MRTATAIALALCAACVLRDPRVKNESCSSNRECGAQEVCFLGECRGRSAALSLVRVEIRPPTDSPYGTTQRQGIDLRNSAVQDLELQQAVVVSGTVVQQQDGGLPPVPLAAATVTFTNQTQPIPGRIQSAMAHTSQSGVFSIRLAAGVWDAFVEPGAPLPPIRFGPQTAAYWNGLELAVPAVSQMTPVSGTVNLVVTSTPPTSGPLANANVVAIDANGEPVSAATVTKADGTFTFLVPKTVSTYSLRIGPSDASAPDLPNWDSVPVSSLATPQVTVTTEPTSILQGVVKDVPGTPIANAFVYALYSHPTEGWRMFRSVSAGADGAYSVSVRRGDSWSIVAAPPGTDPTAPGIKDDLPPVDINAAVVDLEIRCPPKSKAVGRIVLPNGSPAGARYQLAGTRLPTALVTSRYATASPTDDAGFFRLTGDHGEYRLDIEPPLDSGLPRKTVRVLLEGSGTETPLPNDIQLSPPLEVVGTIRGAGTDIIPGASVDFYALDATKKQSIHLGGGLTDAQGRYRAILPDVPTDTLTP